MYSSCTTFGRFNIPHFGHVDLVQKMLCFGHRAHVYVSSGSQNNDWDLRVLLFKVICRDADLDLSRVSFNKSNNPFACVQNSIGVSEYGETALVLGHDQSAMGSKISEELDVPLILNHRKFSSTNARFLIDNGDNEALEACFGGNQYAARLAKILRREEVQRERSYKIAAKAA